MTIQYFWQRHIEYEERYLIDCGLYLCSPFCCQCGYYKVSLWMQVLGKIWTYYTHLLQNISTSWLYKRFVNSFNNGSTITSLGNFIAVLLWKILYPFPKGFLLMQLRSCCVSSVLLENISKLPRPHP